MDTLSLLNNVNAIPEKLLADYKVDFNTRTIIEIEILNLLRIKSALIIKTLKKMRGKQKDELFGICFNLGADEAIGKYTSEAGGQLVYRLVSVLAMDWPKHGGNKAYPVVSKSSAMWDRSTEHGQLRYELLDYLIAKLEATEWEKLDEQ